MIKNLNNFQSHILASFNELALVYLIFVKEIFSAVNSSVIFAAHLATLLKHIMLDFKASQLLKWLYLIMILLGVVIFNNTCMNIVCVYYEFMLILL